MMRRYGLIFACAFALAQPAWADTAELARQVQALQQLAGALDARLGKLEGAIQQNPQLLGLLNEVEMLKAEVARMRGQAEVQMHQLDTLGKRQNDLYADLDQRIADLAKAAQPAPVAAVAQPAASAPTTTPPAAAGGLSQPDPLVESRSYEAALSQFREANYAGAIAGFNGFLKAYPDSALAANAQYWIGYSYYALKDYKSSLAHQQKLVAAYPASPKVPDALLNIAANQIALDNLVGARKTLEDLVAKHPGTNAATLAARRLSALK
ncbi:MAG: tol-pal system protein YbgF [Rhodoferax sp.]|uniref:tol-pal system protein YbgF n=1 Tax=Rhodoferax sp. TaxID=50421 RepID=UPI00273127C3|nr:tol-pal system protein YbgF [Rhodoferax sp.]MDP1529414.1 tol-pal system protein YbgF [Rhodoferax sp.]